MTCYFCTEPAAWFVHVAPLDAIEVKLRLCKQHLPTEVRALHSRLLQDLKKRLESKDQ